MLERRETDIIVLQFSLVIGQDQEGIPEFKTLVQMMEREIAAARLGAFPN